MHSWSPVAHPWLSLLAAVACCAGAVPCRFLSAHDVPNRYFDRSVQIGVGPGRIYVVYELSISELTLAEELMALVGPAGLAELPPTAWLKRFSEEMAQLLAEGLLVEANGEPVNLELAGISYDTAEGHPRFRFRFEGDLPAAGRIELLVEDTNFFLERGSVRMALCALDGAEILQTTAPETVDELPARIRLDMSPDEADEARRLNATVQLTGLVSEAKPRTAKPEEPVASSDGPPRLRELLTASGWGGTAVALGIAFVLGALHALTPGHGKAVAAAFLVGQKASLGHAAALAGSVVVTHTASVFALGITLAIMDPALDRLLGRGLMIVSGGLITLVGLAMLGGRLRRPRKTDPPSRAGVGVALIGAAAGLVPCWDGVALVLWSLAVGRTLFGLVLLLAFTAGLAAVLFAVAVAAVKIGHLIIPTSERLSRALSVASAAVITVVGAAVLWQGWSR